MRHLPTSKTSPCPVCAVADGRCRTHADSDLVLCMSVGDKNSAPPGWRFTGLAKNPLWGKLYPDTQREWSETHRQQWFQEKTARHQRSAQQAAAQRAALPTLQARHSLLSAKPRTLTSAQNADLRRRGLQQSEIDDCLSRGWLWAECGGYGIAAIDPVTGLTVGGQIATDNRDPKYKWLLPGQTHLPETGENPLAFWKSPNFDPEKPAKIRFSEGFLKSLITAIKLWRVDYQVVLVGAAGGQFGEKALVRVVNALPHSEDHVLYPDAGAIANPNVMRGYRRLRDGLRKQGRSLRVIWWQQYTKNFPDCDDLDGSEAIENLKWGEFARLATQQITKLNQRDLPALELPSEGGIFAISAGTGKTKGLEGLLSQFQQRQSRRSSHSH